MDNLQKFAHAFRVHTNDVCVELERIAANPDDPNRVDAMTAALDKFVVHLLVLD